MKTRVLVITPAYNEEKNIAQVLGQIKKNLPSAEILVIDDGSSDQTAEIARKHWVHVVSHPFNMGYGVALQTGYKYATKNNFDYVCQIDADGQHEASYLPQLLATITKNKADVAIGSRFLKKDHHYQTSFTRGIGMNLFGKIVSWMMKQKITDPTSGFQALNRKVTKFFTSDSFPVDFPDADTLLMLHFAGFKVKEIPVVMYPRVGGKSMHQGLKPIYYTFKMFLSIFLTLLREKKKYKEIK